MLIYDSILPLDHVIATKTEVMLWDPRLVIPRLNIFIQHMSQHPWDIGCPSYINPSPRSSDHMFIYVILIDHGTTQGPIP